MNWANRQREEPEVQRKAAAFVDGTSRMMREYQVRICERLGVKFPGPTRQKRRSDCAPVTSGLPRGRDIVRPTDDRSAPQGDRAAQQNIHGSFRRPTGYPTGLRRETTRASYPLALLIGNHCRSRHRRRLHRCRYLHRRRRSTWQPCARDLEPASAVS